VPEELAAHPRYRVVRLLGQGGMGAVYLAEHQRMGRAVALKVISPELLSHAGALSRFQQEARAAAQLDHPNIVTAYDADQAGELHFLVLEHVEGQNLADYLAERGPLPVAEACDCARQAALGLQHAHERGMVHRDIKPHNLMRTPAGRVKVLDFGLARVAAGPALRAEDGTAAGPAHLTGTGAVVGTADYIAPEQARDAHGADGRADVYGLGCTLYHLLAGRPPFPGGTAAEKLSRHAADEPVPLRQLRPDVPERLAAVVARMMAKRPADRYQTPAEAAAALAPYAGADRPRRRRGRRLAAVGAVALVLAAVAGVVLLALAPRGGAVALPDAGAPPETAAAPPEPQEFEGRCQGGVLGLRLSPDGAHAVTTSADLTVRLWDVPARRLVRTFQGHTLWPRDAALSPDGRQVLSGGDDRVLRLWDVTTGRPVRTFGLHEQKITAVAFSPDGRRALSASWDATVRLWDVGTGRHIRTLGGHVGHVLDVAFAPDGRRALSGGEDGRVRLWDTNTGNELRRLEGHTGWVLRVAVAADGRRAVSGGADGTVRLWDLAAGKEVGRFDGHGSPVRAVALSRDGRLAFAAVSPFEPATEGERGVRVWDTASGREVHHLPTGDAHGLAVAPDGRSVLVADFGRPTLRRWPLPGSPEPDAPPPPRGEERRFAGPPASRVTAVAFSADGGQVHAAAGDGGFRVWDRATGREVRRFGGPAGAAGAAFAPDGWAVSSGQDGTVRVWDAATGREVRHFAGYTPTVVALAVSADGKRLLSLDQGPTLRLWDAERGLPLHSHPLPPGPVRALALSPDGAAVLWGGPDGHVHGWIAETGAEMRLLRGHEGPVLAAAFSPDGRLALTGGEDGTARLWDLETEREVVRFDGHALPVEAVPSPRTAAAPCPSAWTARPGCGTWRRAGSCAASTTAPARSPARPTAGTPSPRAAPTGRCGCGACPRRRRPARSACRRRRRCGPGNTAGTSGATRCTCTPGSPPSPRTAGPTPRPARSARCACGT
jgi:WD40 repeat protein